MSQIRKEIEQVVVTRYRCLLCGTAFGFELHAEQCASKPLMPAIFKVGDRVRVLGGDGAGEVGVVEKVTYADCQWGHHFAPNYHHTPIYRVEIRGGMGVVGGAVMVCTYDGVGAAPVGGDV